MKITYDPAKRQRTFDERGLDFDHAPKVFSAFHVTQPDTRPYTEAREITVGLLDGEVIVMVWTERDDSCRVISMRKADRDERESYFRELDRPG